jgi:hypothetical protein
MEYPETSKTAQVCISINTGSVEKLKYMSSKLVSQNWFREKLRNITTKTGSMEKLRNITVKTGSVKKLRNITTNTGSMKSSGRLLPKLD